jgi:hypothetical protein
MIYEYLSHQIASVLSDHPFQQRMVVPETEWVRRNFGVERGYVPDRGLRSHEQACLANAEVYLM